MTRVLIVSYYFAPQNVIGAVRPVKLAKYLTRMGCDVTVICGTGMSPERRDPTLERDMAELTDVHVIDEWNPLRAVKRKRQTAVQSDNASAAAQVRTDKASLKGRVLDAAYIYLRLLADRSFQRKAKRELGKLQGVYDAVFSTYAPLSVHNVAREAKRRGVACKWIADFRDEVGVSFRWQAGEKRRFMEMLRREPDLLTAASDGFLKMMKLDGRMLSNGFDREDMPPAPATERDKRFRAVYCGQLNEGRRGVAARDVTPCFMALRGLIDKGALSRDELELVYAGGEGNVFLKYAEAAGLGENARDLGRVSRDRSLALQADASLLMMASVNAQNQFGILTGKLFEYMMMGKPIVCCMGGDLTNSDMKRVLCETGAGFCWEAANAQSDTPALASWLRDIISAWRQDLPTVTANVRAQTEQFSYPNLASTLLSWIREEEKGSNER